MLKPDVMLSACNIILSEIKMDCYMLNYILHQEVMPTQPSAVLCSEVLGFLGIAKWLGKVRLCYRN